MIFDIQTTACKQRYDVTARSTYTSDDTAKSTCATEDNSKQGLRGGHAFNTHLNSKTADGRTVHYGDQIAFNKYNGTLV